MYSSDMSSFSGDDMGNYMYPMAIGSFLNHSHQGNISIFKASLTNPNTGILFYNDDLKYTINVR